MKRYSLISLCFVLLSCETKPELKVGQEVYADETYRLPVYRLAIPLTAEELDKAKMDIVERKELRERVGSRFPVFFQVFDIDEDQYYRNGSSLIGIVKGDTSATIYGRHESKEKLLEIEFNKNIKLNPFSDVAQRGRDDPAYREVEGKLYVKPSDVTGVSPEKYQ